MWVKFTKDAGRVSRQAERLGVMTGREAEFVGAQKASMFLRLGFTPQSPHELREGVALLMKAVDRA